MKYRIERVEYGSRTWYELKVKRLFWWRYVCGWEIDESGSSYGRIEFKSVQEAEDHLIVTKEKRTLIKES
jgi:hypothetical protein